MAVSVKGTLKDLPLKLQTSSLKQRKKLFHDLGSVLAPEVLKEGEVPVEAVVKGICRVLTVVLPRYCDSHSRGLALGLVKELIKSHGDVTVPALTASLQETFVSWATIVPTKPNAKIALASLEWIKAIIVLSESKISGSDAKKLLEIQSLLATVIFSAGQDSPKVGKVGLKLLEGIWQSSPLAVDSTLEALKNANQTIQTLVFGSVFLQWLSGKKDNEDKVKDLKSSLLESLIKNIISSKNKTSPFVLKSISPLLKLVTHEELKNSLLPTMTKAMLRNPEIIVESIGQILLALSLDLSQYAEELGKSFGTHLHAKDDLLREDAVAAMSSLSKQCSDASAIETLLVTVFGVLNGSEGKLSVNTQKMSLLQAGGNLSKNAVLSSSIGPICHMATDHFIKILESEVHEGTLIMALENLSMWAAKFGRDIPQKFIEWIPKGMALKSSTAGVRSAYLQCLYGALVSSASFDQKLIRPVLVKALENCIRQPSQVAIVTEGVHAAACLLKMASPDESIPELTKLLNAEGAADKQIFTNDKFVLTAGPGALRSLTNIAEKLILDPTVVSPSGNEVSNVDRWFRVIVIALTCGHTETRNQAASTIKKIVAGLAGYQNSVSLVNELRSHMWNGPAVTVVSTISDSESGETGGGNRDIAASGTTHQVKADFVVKALITISKATTYEEEGAKKLAQSFVVPSHHPIVAKTHRGLWPLLVRNIGLQAKDLLGINNAEQILDEVRRAADSDADKEGSAAQPAISALVSVYPDGLVPKLVEIFVETLTRKDIQIGDHEFAVYETPDGVVYDKSVIESLNQQQGNEAKNVRRENKAYSYKDQMEEIALRKELEEKKRREGKLVEPKLSPKQQEILDAQLEKESQIRQKVRTLKLQLDKIILLITAAIQGCPKGFTRVVGEGQLLSAIYQGLKSPLAIDGLSNLLFHLRKAVIDSEEESLGQSVVAVTIQVICPHKYLKEPWSKSTMSVSLVSILDQLHKLTVGDTKKQPTSYDTSEMDETACPLTTPAFHFSFALLRAALMANLPKPSSVQDSESEVDSTVYKGLEVINEHALLRGNADEDDEENLCEPDDLHPKYLPRAELLSTLIEILSKTEGRTRQFAVNTLVEVASASSGQTGCARATEKEVSILLGALQNDTEAVRDAALRGLIAMKNALKTDNLNLIRRIWVTRFDPVSENQTLAEDLWSSIELSRYPELSTHLLEDIVHPVDCVRQSAAEALAQLLKDSNKNKNEIGIILACLLETYEEKLERSAAIVDNLGRVVVPSVDHWEPRSGIAVALSKISPFFDQAMVKKVASFFVQEGLGDRHDNVRKNMLDAAVLTVDLHGKSSAEELLPIFEDFLDHAPSDQSYDNVRQSVVILMGSLAKHLESNDPKVRPIMRQLIIALNTPSQQVQEAVANCLPPLVPSIKEDAPEIVSNLINTLLGAKISYGERRGAAYGIAGIVKGLGILSLKQLDIMKKLTDAVTDKKNPNYREGALFAFEMLCHMLGRLFEPYIVHMLPHLLLCFGDPVDYVRQAADETAKAVMSKLSAHGVKLVLPSLLNALEEDQWRTKTGSVELLGAMAFCAPKQLSSCLPAIVPKLIEVLGDSHHKVQQAGAQALKVIGSVIRNPEIQAIVPILLKALQDPAKKTGLCLQTLLDTKFVHFIDAPSLALIMPVVQRAFQDRSTETRKMAAQIIGNMYSLTDQKDLSPYLPGIIPGLKTSLLDPVPEVRAVSARALGAMVRGMGETSFEELLPWLMATLTSESSSVDRSGAAQGLAEVVGGLGVEKMNAVMPDIIRHSERNDIAPHVKDGYIMMFIYMPSVFPDEFTKYIGQITGPVLRALADENEFVRETAYKAGQRLVMMYADSAITLLLPELERGLFDDNWRIRHSSVQLLGDLLYKISGVSGKMTTETAGEDDNFGTEQSQKAIQKRLGETRCHRVLAGLYMGRSDVALMVRQASLHVWKVIVSNTPKTLREILPTLFNLLLGCLASNSYDKRQVAARTLGDLVKKLGERVLPEIIPILEEGLASPLPEKRQGVCVGLSEIMVSTSKEMVLTFVNSLVPTVRKALCDDLPEVRQAAAKTFDSLHNTVGSRALDDILPPMLLLLSQKHDTEETQRIYDNTIDGLRQVMAIKARAVLPYLVPQLIGPPVNTRALASLSPVAGEALHRHLPKILPALVNALTAARGTPREAEILEHAEAVVLAVSDDSSEIGIGCIMEELLGACNKGRELEVQRSAITLLHSFCRETKCDYSQYVPQLLRSFILLFTSKDEVILQHAWNALAAVTKTMDPEDQMAHVSDVRQAVRFAVMELKVSGDVLMPGFCLPKGIQPILPIFRESILNGTPELKEQAAIGLGEVINLTDEEALKPSVVHITGPLIRILGDRFSHNVKTAVLDTLASLLKKAGSLLKPFFPQLQTTFMKALNDPNRTVRLKAGVALAYLINIHMRPDPLFNELQTGIKNADDSAVRETYLQALRGCLGPAGSKMSPPVRRQLLQHLLSYESHPEDVIRSSACGCLGAFAKWLPDDEADMLINDHLLADDSSALDWTLRHGRSTGLFVALKLAPERIYDANPDRQRKVIAIARSHLSADRVPIARNGVRSCGYLFRYLNQSGETLPVDLIQPFSKAMNHASNDVKQLLAIVSTFIAKGSENILPSDLLRSLLPMLVNGTKEKNSAVKASSESALVALLHLRDEDKSIQDACLKVLDSGARDALSDVITKVLLRVANTPEGKDEIIDDTLLA